MVPSKKLRIVLVDDHPLVLMGIRELLARDINLEVEAMVSTPSELVERLGTCAPDIVVTDYSMPGDARYGDGMRFISYLRRHFPEVGIIVLTMVSTPMIVSSLYDAGVLGVVMKQDNLDALLVALTLARRGLRYYPPGFRQDMSVGGEVRSLQERVDSLSTREFEVLRLFVQGASITEIAGQLHRSVTTISAQKTSAMRKLGAQNNQELISFCLEHGLF
ncbi:DNA-binding response regulator, LuxR family OS=Castellaniella defragrans (strain DSM / CCUG 39792 / 65Phen) OX=1437824 GN=BN940_03221 PE=4 SV=1 [Castellaniella denitrificans]|jgi:two-component system capsular synthesis response regulator RcsB|uniref:response regulator n=1 Tax=Castellaniella denitrificans TaxID=56119 RepID=UPI001ACADAD5|nr:response regulator transcription factor [Burkholderiales bacterium]